MRPSLLAGRACPPCWCLRACRLSDIHPGDANTEGANGTRVRELRDALLEDDSCYGTFLYVELWHRFAAIFTTETSAAEAVRLAASVLALLGFWEASITKLKGQGMTLKDNFITSPSSWAPPPCERTAMRVLKYDPAQIIPLPDLLCPLPLLLVPPPTHTRACIQAV